MCRQRDDVDTQNTPWPHSRSIAWHSPKPKFAHPGSVQVSAGCERLRSLTALAVGPGPLFAEIPFAVNIF